MGHPLRTITMELPGSPRRYDIRVGPDALAELPTTLPALTPGRSAFLVIDDRVPDTLAASVETSLIAAGFTITRTAIHASETNKSLPTASTLIDQLANARLERTDTLIAIGGGIICDIAGFAAATYRRGIQLIQCPTTLLAMVDASVGGKTGVNLHTPTGLRKNLAGAFYQPRLVIADTHALASLPPRIFRAGLGECLKHGMISADIDPDLFQWTLNNLNNILAQHPETLTQLIARNIAVKKHFVQLDEHETANDPKRSRMLLNLGHTYAHALESIPTLSPDTTPQAAPLQHGEAVLLGLVAAAHAAIALNLSTQPAADTIRAAVEQLGIPTRLTSLPPNRVLFDRMAEDKKAAAGQLRIIAPDGPGSARVVVNPPFQALETGWDAISSP